VQVEPQRKLQEEEEEEVNEKRRELEGEE